MERRRSKRTKVVLPVKVSVSGTSQLAHTCDLTYSGARVGGLHKELKKGEIVSLQRGSKKASFKVVWVQQLGPNEIQVGLQATQRQNNLFWGVDLPDQNREMKDSADAVAVGKKA
ncbi:MAG: PilZ domain-containing protein [Acidobacteriaceae bacterium]|nr:PilZ domain-containing protein [Acidobacteriaceae bacterium]